MRFDNIVTGLFLISTGILLTLNTNGIVSWSVWRYLLQWWPLLLIALGFQIIFGRKLVLLIAAVLIWVVTWYYISSCPIIF